MNKIKKKKSQPQIVQEQKSAALTMQLFWSDPHFRPNAATTHLNHLSGYKMQCSFLSLHEM